jgi:hypothetical protein
MHIAGSTSCLLPLSPCRRRSCWSKKHTDFWPSGLAVCSGDSRQQSCHMQTLNRDFGEGGCMVRLSGVAAGTRCRLRGTNRDSQPLRHGTFAAPLLHPPAWIKSNETHFANASVSERRRRLFLLATATAAQGARRRAIIHISLAFDTWRGQFRLSQLLLAFRADHFGSFADGIRAVCSVVWCGVVIPRIRVRQVCLRQAGRCAAGAEMQHQS